MATELQSRECGEVHLSGRPKRQRDALGRFKKGSVVLGPRDRRYRYIDSKRWIKYFTAGFDLEDAAAIEALAKKENCTIAEAIRTLVTWGLEQR